MNKSEIKEILMSMRTTENESKVNNLLGKIDIIEDSKLEAMISQIGDNETDIRDYLQKKLEDKKEYGSKEHIPINDMFTYGVTGNCIHLHMPVDLHDMIKENGISRTIDIVNLQLLDAIERVRIMQNDGYYKFQEMESLYMISPILGLKERKFLNNLDFKTKSYNVKELKDEKFVSEHPEAQLATRIFGKDQNVGTAIIGLDVVNTEEWQEKRKAQVKALEEKGIKLDDKYKNKGEKDE